MDQNQGRRRPSRRGRLRIFLGAAAGVGKTYSMLGEARGLKAAGVDVVIGYLEAHGRRATEDRAAGIEVAPRRVARRGDRTFTEMDVDWILERGPQLCLVDELAHSNQPGGRNAKRWQDVEELLDAGIDVDTTVNIQHLESLNDKIYEITGVRVRETFPDRLLHEANSVVVVDLPPEALRERIAQGRVYTPEKVPTALANFFRSENLTALRALVLREVADQEEQEEKTIRTAERVLVCIDGRPNSEGLVRRAARLARRVDARLWFLHVEPEGERLSREAAATVDRAGTLAARLGVTQIVLGESHRPRWREVVGQSIIANILRETDGVDILIVADARARLEEPHGDPGQEG